MEARQPSMPELTPQEADSGRRKISATRWCEIGLVLTAVFWGLGFVVTKNALDMVGPVTFTGWRFLSAALIVTPIFAVHHRRKQLRWNNYPLTMGSAAGLLLAAGYILQTIGLEQTASGKAAFITGIHVVLVPVFAAIFLRKPPKRTVVLGVIIALGGLALLSLDLQSERTFQKGDIWILTSAVSYALHIVMINYLVERYDSLALATQQLWAITIACIFSSFLFEYPGMDTLDQVRPILWHVLFTGAFGSLFALFMLTKAQEYVSATKTGLILILETVFGALFGFLLAGEHMGAKELIGCSVILGSLIWVQKKTADT